MKNGKSEKCSMKPEFIHGANGAMKKQQPNNHVPNQKKTKKVVI